MNEQDMKKLQEELKVLREKEAKMKERTKKYGERSRVRNLLLLEKCKKQNITVSNQEIDEYIAKNKK